MKKHRGLRIYSIFTTFTLLVVSFGIFWLLLARDRQGISMMVFGYDRYDSSYNIGERKVMVLNEKQQARLSSTYQTLDKLPFEQKSKPKKTIIIAYPRKLFYNCLTLLLMGGGCRNMVDLSIFELLQLLF